jgi:opine dehydrogenase
MNPIVAVLGAGNGAHAFAGDLALRDYIVRLYNRFEFELLDLRASGGVTLEGAVNGFGKLDLVTHDIASATAEADLILVVVPANVHVFMAEACAPHLRDNQIILLNPGRTGGALEFRNVLNRMDVKARVLVAEAQTLLYTCRLSGPARVHISSVKHRVPLAALPAGDTQLILERLHPLFPQFVAAADVLETGLDNIGAMFHPAGLVLNTGRIEAGETFEFYLDMTPSMVRLIEALDAERLAVAQALDVHAISAFDWLPRSYGDIQGITLIERIHNNLAYRDIPAPHTLDSRYVSEDVPTGLVPLVALGQLAGIETPISRGLVNICCALYRRDFWQEGRNAEQLGIAGMNIAQVKQLVRENSFNT